MRVPQNLLRATREINARLRLIGPSPFCRLEASGVLCTAA